MNKAELIEKLAEACNLSKAETGRVLDLMHEIITTAVAGGDKVAVADWGTYVVSERASRTGRNPQTGASMQIPASKSVKFKAAKKLKDAVN